MQELKILINSIILDIKDYIMEKLPMLYPEDLPTPKKSLKQLEKDNRKN
jgi:hypothetical protein